MRRCSSAEKMFGEYNNSIHRWRTVLYDDVSECMTGNEFPHAPSIVGVLSCQINLLRK